MPLVKRRRALAHFTAGVFGVTAVAFAAFVIETLAGRASASWTEGTFLSQMQVIFGVAGAAVSLVAVLLAWGVAEKQFDLMDEQGAIVDRQVKLMEDHKKIFLRLEMLLAAQTGIAQTQHQILQNQLARRSDPRITLSIKHISSDSVEYKVALHNAGNKSMDATYWHVYIHKGRTQHVGWNEKHVSEVVNLDGVAFEHFNGLLRDPVFPTRYVTIGAITVSFKELTRMPYPIRWYAVTEDGKVPAEGVSEFAIGPLQPGDEAGKIFP